MSNICCTYCWSGKGHRAAIWWPLEVLRLMPKILNEFLTEIRVATATTRNGRGLRTHTLTHTPLPTPALCVCVLPFPPEGGKTGKTSQEYALKNEWKLAKANYCKFFSSVFSLVVLGCVYLCVLVLLSIFQREKGTNNTKICKVKRAKSSRKNTRTRFSEGCLHIFPPFFIPRLCCCHPPTACPFPPYPCHLLILPVLPSFSCRFHFYGA